MLPLYQYYLLQRVRKNFFFKSLTEKKKKSEQETYLIQYSFDLMMQKMQIIPEKTLPHVLYMHLVHDVVMRNTISYLHIV